MSRHAAWGLMILMSIPLLFSSCRGLRTSGPGTTTEVYVYRDPRLGDLASQKKFFATKNIQGNIDYREIKDYSTDQQPRLAVEAYFFEPAEVNPAFDGGDAKEKVSYLSSGPTLRFFEAVGDPAASEDPAVPQSIAMVGKHVSTDGKTKFYATPGAEVLDFPKINFTHAEGSNIFVEAVGGGEGGIPSFQSALAMPEQFSNDLDTVELTVGGDAKFEWHPSTVEGSLIVITLERKKYEPNAIGHHTKVTPKRFVVKAKDSAGQIVVPGGDVTKGLGDEAGVGVYSVARQITGNFNLENGNAINYRTAYQMNASFTYAAAAE